MGNPYFILSTCLKFTAPIITFRSFVMMLTWRVFVIIISVVTLTLDNVNSSSEPSSSGASRRPKRVRRSLNENSSYTPASSSKPVKKQKGIFKIYDLESDLSFELQYNTYNPFDRTEILGYDCFQQLRMFCDTEIYELSSGKCAHNGILMYKKSFMNYNDGINYLILLDAVHLFFWNFPLSIRAIDFPQKFCDKEADIFMKDLNNYQVYFTQFQESMKGLQQVRNENVESCMKELNNYQELVIDLKNQFYDRQIERDAIKESRGKIVKYALINRSKLGLDPNSIEVKYLNHISEHISSANSDHNPHVYCRNLQDQYEMKRLTHPHFP